MPEPGTLSIIQALANLRDRPPPPFGADHHAFRTEPPLSESFIIAFEQQHQIALPREYRNFLTSVGNGGAGPFYGVFPLGRVDDGFNLRTWTATDVGVLSKPFLFQKAWNDLTAKPADDLLVQNEAEYWKQEEAFEAAYWSTALVNGTIPVCHQGCALRTLLAVTGPQAGFLWDDRRSEYAGLQLVRLVDGTPATFLGWYNEWLTNCLGVANSPHDKLGL